MLCESNNSSEATNNLPCRRPWIQFYTVRLNFCTSYQIINYFLFNTSSKTCPSCLLRGSHYLEYQCSWMTWDWYIYPFKLQRSDVSSSMKKLIFSHMLMEQKKLILGSEAKIQMVRWKYYYINFEVNALQIINQRDMLYKTIFSNLDCNKN